MKKILSILFLSAMLLPFSGTFLWLQYEKTLVQNEMQEKISKGVNEESLVELSFTKKEASKSISWKNPHEFEYNEKLYDIVETKDMGDSIHFLCVFDAEESELEEKIRELVASHIETDSQKEESQNRLTNFYQTLFFSENETKKPSLLIEKKLSKPLYTFSCISYSLPPLVPPPQFD